MPHMETEPEPASASEGEKKLLHSLISQDMPVPA